MVKAWRWRSGNWHQPGHLLPVAQGIRRDERRSAAPAQRRAAAPRRGRPDTGQANPDGAGPRKLLRPSPRRRFIEHDRSRLEVSQRQACRVLARHRSIQRRSPREWVRDLLSDEEGYASAWLEERLAGIEGFTRKQNAASISHTLSTLLRQFALEYRATNETDFDVSELFR